MLGDKMTDVLMHKTVHFWVILWRQNIKLEYNKNPKYDQSIDNIKSFKSPFKNGPIFKNDRAIGADTGKEAQQIPILFPIWNSINLPPACHKPDLDSRE